MRARINPAAITSKMRKDAAREYVENEVKKQHEGNVRRLLKLMCVCLNDEFGFGKDRLRRLLCIITAVADDHLDDEVYWEHMDRRLAQIGLDFATENYEEMERKKR